ncbi:hypothetical protein Tco_0645810 [Tanacetum coccineum]
MTTKAQQIELDNALVAPENRHVIGKCNMRINPGMKPKEPTYQVALDALALTTCYPAFLITAEVPVIYMHQLWATVIKHKSSYQFKIDKKRFFVNVEVFREILNIGPKVPGKAFEEPPTKEEALSFIRELGHTGEIKYITDVIIDHLHQPWRTFTSIINKCLCGKGSGLDKIRMSRVQILYEMYYKKNLDFIALIWEDLAYLIDNIDSKKQDRMFYPRFTKIIIHYFLRKDKSISMRNIMFMHTARDDSLLGTMRFISKHAGTQVYSAILPQAMTNQALLDSVANKTYYAIATGAEPLISRKIQKKSDSAISSEESPSKKKSAKAKDVTATKPKPTKKKAPIKADRGKGDSREEDDDDEIDFEDESDNDDDDHCNDDNDNDDDANDDDNQEGDDTNDDNKETDSDRTESDRIKIPVLNQSIIEYYEEEEEKIDDEEKMDKEEDDEVTKELYNDVNVNLGNRDADMTNADQGGADQQNVSQESGFKQLDEDAHVTLTLVLDTQKADEPVQSYSVSSDFTRKLLNLENPSPADNEIASLMDTTTHHTTVVPEITSVFTITIPPPHPFFNPLTQQATPTPTPTTSEATTSFPSLLDFLSIFKFNDRVTNLEKNLSEIKQVDQYAQALSFIPAIVDRYIDNKLGEAIQKAIVAHNLDYFATPMIEKNVIKSLEAAVLAKSSSQPKSTYEAETSLSEFELTKILIDKMEKNKSYDNADYKRELYDALVKSYQTNKDLFDTYGEVFTLKRSRDDRDKDQDPSAGSDQWTKRRKSSKEAESSKDSRSKEKMSSSTSKDSSHYQQKPSGKFAHA